MREGVDNTRVSPFSFISARSHNFICSSHMCSFAGSHVCSQRAMGVTLPEDAVKREVNNAIDEKLWARK
jgi:hypothetical protein